MQKSYRFILFSLVLLLIAGGFLLILFRNSWVSYFESQMNLVNSLTTATTTVSAADTLDPGLLKLKRFTALTSQVINFDFDNICWRPDTVKSRLATPAGIGTTTIATTTGEISAPLGCRRGNDFPFVIKTK